MSNKTPANKDAKTASAPNHYLIASLLVLVVVILLFAFVCFTFLTDKKMVIGGQKLDVEVASSSSSRERGLSGRNRLGKNQGMLFTYTVSDEYCVWMKDMKFDIDVIWLNKDKQIKTIKEGIKPSSYPQKIYCPDEAIQYILEVPSGSARKWHLKVGDWASF